MQDSVTTPNFEQVRKEVCNYFAYRLRDPRLTLEKRLELLETVRKLVNEAIPE